MGFTNKTLKISQTLISEMKLPAGFEQIIESVYLSLAEQIISRKAEEPLFLSINGAQGTGKSTLTHFLKKLIESESDMSVVEISLDDFYSTLKEREHLAKSIHPLLLTRGVPGTHDLQLMENTLSMLVEGYACEIPRFNKAIDDRHNRAQWTSCSQYTDIILFEGWCNHSPVQSKDELLSPINELESNEDKGGIWRNYANEKLKEYHEKIFCHADMSIMLKAPNFEKIYEWRKLQEEKLKQTIQNSEQSRIMSSDELNRFIQHYERITRHTLNVLPSTVDIVIPIENDHSIKKMIKCND